MESSDLSPLTNSPGLLELGLPDAIRCIADSQNPEQAYEELSANPPLAQSVLEDTELQLSRAASDLETGIRYKSEKHRYETAFCDYEIILGLASKKMLKEHPLLATREDLAKRDVIDFMIASKQRIIESDVHRRLEISRLERAKERIARSSLSLFTGKVALYGSSGIIAVGAVNAFEAGPGDFFEHVSTKIGMGTLAVLGVYAAIRAGARAGRELGFRQIAFYSLAKETGKKTVTTEAGQVDAIEAVIYETGPDEEAVHKRLAKHHIKDARKALAEIAMDTDLSAPSTSVDTLVKTLVEALEGSLDQFYRLKDPDPDKKKFLPRLLSKLKLSKNL